MAETKFLKFGEQAPVERGNGAVTWPLVGGADGTGSFTAGVSRFPPGLEVPLHAHNVEEMVTVLEGAGECEIDGVVRPVGPFDTTFIPGGVTHCFRNTGAAPMAILWVYAGANVTRTFAATGETVAHLSGDDLVAR